MPGKTSYSCGPSKEMTKEIMSKSTKTKKSLFTKKDKKNGKR